MSVLDKLGLKITNLELLFRLDMIFLSKITIVKIHVHIQNSKKLKITHIAFFMRNSKKKDLVEGTALLKTKITLKLLYKRAIA